MAVDYTKELVLRQQYELYHVKSNRNKSLWTKKEMSTLVNVIAVLLANVLTLNRSDSHIETYRFVGEKPSGFA